MIVELLRLERPLVVLDLETTGLVAETDRIVEVAFQVWKPDGALDEWRSLVNPIIAIPPAVTKVHGITDAMMKGCRVCGGRRDDVNATFCTCEEFHPIPTFVQIAAKLARGFTNVDFCGKNVRFDLGFIGAEMRRANVEWNYVGAYVLDADALERIAKPRDLSTLYKLYTGEDHLDAHSALADVRATTRVIEEQLKTHETVLPRSLRELHELSWPDWVDSEGRVRLRDGVAILSFGKHRGVPLDKVPRDYWQGFVLKNNFSEEFKQIARDALTGKYS